MRDYQQGQAAHLYNNTPVYNDHELNNYYCLSSLAHELFMNTQAGIWSSSSVVQAYYYID